jgi:hypothetical protein
MVLVDAAFPAPDRIGIVTLHDIIRFQNQLADAMV